MEYIWNRLKEPSSWAGIVAIITGVTGWALPPEQLQNVIAAGTSVVGFLLFIMKSSKSKDAVVNPTAVSNGKAAVAAGEIKS